jgi:quercetin dioxygenase-like cupin family protein
MMLKGNLNNEPLSSRTELGLLEVYKKIFGIDPFMPVANNLRFLFSTSAFELTSADKTQFVTERSAVKVHPGTEVKLNMEKGARLYEIVLQADEQVMIHKLQKEHYDFFSSLDGLDKQEWNEVANAGKDYIIPSERNSQDMVRMPGIIIAPSYSRHNKHTNTGWHFMYARASKALSVGSDMIFKVRSEEIAHSHKIISESYVCLGGSLELMLDGEKTALREGDYIIATPRENHSIVSLPEVPYKGLTLQFPSIPGDRYDESGEKIKR